MSMYGRSRTGRWMLIGGAIGCGLSLLGRQTRAVWGNRLSSAASGSAKLIRTIYNHPQQVGRYLSLTGSRLQGVAREVSADFRQMIDYADKARKDSGSAYRYVMEAGGELGEMAGKIRRTGESLVRFDEPVLIDSESDALQRLETETSLPNALSGQETGLDSSKL
ncbi:MAG: hypothetical protein LKI94_07055 [Sporolactobacillus sp.]|nr:hypothetical protein [Sporolactobacillus sp.]